MRRHAIALTAVALGLTAGPARGDGLPLVDYGSRPDGIALPGDTTARYITIPAGKDRTIVAEIDPQTASVRRSRVLRGELNVPAVAYDGTAGGLSADGRTLTLIKPRRRFPRNTTPLTLLNRRLGLRQNITLPGDFSFDAIAPDGSALFLVEYPNRRNPGVYRVRVYDVARHRLLPKPLLDSRTAAVVMRGLPVTRTTSPDGRTAYTLYDGLGTPFIHALDTVGRSARCILLPHPRQASDPSRLRLKMAAGGRAFTVVDTTTDTPLAIVDTASDIARPPAPPSAGLVATVLAVATPQAT